MGTMAFIATIAEFYVNKSPRTFEGPRLFIIIGTIGLYLINHLT